MIHCASVVSKKSLKEFLLLDYSMTLFQDVDWHISCDNEVASYLSKIDSDKYKLIPVIKDDNGTHGVNDPAKNEVHMQLMMTKFDACRSALKEHEYVLFLDSDMIFTNKIDDNILGLFESKHIDAILSPHSTENKQLESQVGHFNGGMFCIRSKDFLEDWFSLSKSYKQFGMYYEQQPIEYASKSYTTVNFPIQYNIGWWRMNEAHTSKRVESILLDSPHQDLVFLGKKAVNFHVHTLKELDYVNYGETMLSRLLLCMSQSKKVEYDLIVKKLVELQTSEVT